MFSLSLSTFNSVYQQINILFQKASEHKIKFTRVYWTKYVFTSLFIWLRILFLNGQVKMKWNLPPQACYNTIEDYFLYKLDLLNS
jgi:hypothetical protein